MKPEECQCDFVKENLPNPLHPRMGIFTYMHRRNQLNVGKYTIQPYMDGMGKGNSE